MPTLDIRRIDDELSFAPQITPDDMAAIREAGFATIINNRPDGEEAGQPASIAITDAAVKAGLGCVAIPIGHPGFSHPQVSAMREVLDSAPGPVLAFCRSGTRSCWLWALARAESGDDVEDIIARAADAGYDIAAAWPLLLALSSKS